MSNDKPFEKNMNVDVQIMLRLYLDSAKLVYDSPYMVQARADAKAEWDALPWYVKAYRRSWLPEVFWRITVAFSVLRRGEQSDWLGD